MRPITAMASLGLAVAALLVTGLLSGAVAIGPGDVIHMLGRRLGLTTSPERLTDSVLWAVRLPRVLAGVAVGAGLGAAAAALQGTFRNPMADPHLVGLSPAAGLGAVAGIAASPAGGAPWLMMVAAVAAATITALAIRSIARRFIEPTEFILVGLALGLAMLAWLGSIVLAWDDPRLPTFTFWVFGGLAGATWSALAAAAPFIVTGFVIIAWSAPSLDVLSLGEAEARHVGVNVDRVIPVILIGVGLATGAAVGLGGVIGFVGLIAPALLRRWMGPGHRWLVPASALAGAAIVVAVDILARTLAAPIEIPVGLFTGILGAPVFVWLLTRGGRSYR